MLTTLEVRSLYEGDPSVVFTTLTIPILGWAAASPLVVRNITGLEPAPATISTKNYSSLDGDFFAGSRLQRRNIVFTLGINSNTGPDGVDAIRRMCYAYGMMPKALVSLRFIYDDGRDSIEIRGYVETVTNDRFAKDPSVVVSVICPKPNFVSTVERTVTGVTNASSPTSFDMNGNMVTGLVMTLPMGSTALGPNEDLTIEFGGATSLDKFFALTNTSIPSGQTFAINGNRGAKFVGYSVLSLLKYMNLSSLWPYLIPGGNKFRIMTPDTPGWTKTWTMKFRDEYGSA